MYLEFNFPKKDRPLLLLLLDFAFDLVLPKILLLPNLHKIPYHKLLFIYLI